MAQRPMAVLQPNVPGEFKAQFPRAVFERPVFMVHPKTDPKTVGVDAADEAVAQVTPAAQVEQAVRT